jgi:predicted lipid carrier protein YhbT
MNDDGLFSERRTSLATLGDKEFELAVRACLDHSTDDLVESIGRECPAWLENWVDSLEAEELYGVDSDEPPVS